MQQLYYGKLCKWILMVVRLEFSCDNPGLESTYGYGYNGAALIYCAPPADYSK
jgi:hypothetical protein